MNDQRRIGDGLVLLEMLDDQRCSLEFVRNWIWLKGMYIEDGVEDVE